MAEVRAQGERIPNYLMVKFPDERIMFADRQGLPSQFMRKVVASINNRPDWDWREADSALSLSASIAALASKFGKLERRQERHARNNLASCSA